MWTTSRNVCSPRLFRFPVFLYVMKWVGGDSQDDPASASGMLGNGSHATLQNVSIVNTLYCLLVVNIVFVYCQVPDMARPVSSRSQDDLHVAYIFQRPQTDGNFQAFGKHQSRWLGDESIVEVSRLWKLYLILQTFIYCHLTGQASSCHRSCPSISFSINFSQQSTEKPVWSGMFILTFLQLPL